LKKYFEKLGLHDDSSKILKIAGKGMLYAEVVIPNGKGSALYFHAKVTALKQTSDTGPY
jgi:hypothetical protein